MKQTATIHEKRLKRAINQYKSWTKDNAHYEKAVSSFYFMSGYTYETFQKALRSGKPDAGWTAIMQVSNREVDLTYYGCLRLLAGDSEGWDYIDLALEGSWMNFKLSHFGDIEAGTAFMLAYFYLIGYKKRADYLGEFFYYFERDEKAKEQLEHTDIPRFIVQLWAKSKNLPTERLGEFLEFERKDSGYGELARLLYEPDCSDIERAIELALDFHIEQSAKESGWMCTSLAFYLFPVEILYFLKLREERGLTTRVPSEHILWREYEKIKPTLGGAVKMPQRDEAFMLAFNKAVSQGFFKAEDLDFL